MIAHISASAAAALCAALLSVPSTPLSSEVPSSEAPPSAATLLSMVPEASYGLAHCADFAALRARAERNDWFRLMNAEAGADLLFELSMEFQSATHTDLDDLLDVGKHLQGESVYFMTEQVAGFVTEAPADRRHLVEAMRAWLPEPSADSISRNIDVGGAQVEMIAWRPDFLSGWQGRNGHFAAFVDHPRVVGLFSGDDVESLMSTMKDSLAGYGSERRAPLVVDFEAARATAKRCDGAELYIDFSPFVAQAEAELKSGMEGFLPDPTGMLGLERGLWMHTAIDVYPGTRIDCQALLNIPKDTLAAHLADTFEALPSTLPAQLPKDLLNLYAWRWNLPEFYQRARTAYVERHGEEALEPVDAALEAAESMSGVDPIAELIQQLEGTFAVFEMRTEVERDDFFDLDGWGMLASLVDGETFLDVIDRLTGNVPLSDELDLVEIEGADVYVFGEDGDDPGLAIMPKLLLLGLRESLPRSLRAATGVAGSNMLDGSKMHAAFDQSLGCCVFIYQDLATLEAQVLEDSSGLVLPKLEGEAQGRRPFESMLLYTARRTADGFRFLLRTE